MALLLNIDDLIHQRRQEMKHEEESDKGRTINERISDFAIHDARGVGEG